VAVMNSEFDVVIVGAGMVGATIACGLARSNLKVAIIDPQKAKPFIENEHPHIRVSAISFASEQVLKHVGAWQYITSKRSCPYRRLAVNELPAKEGLAAKLPDISSWARTEFDASSIGQTHLGHIIENDIVHLALHEQMESLKSLSIFCPDKVVSMDLQAEKKKIVLSKQGEITARLVIGAEGAQSQVRIQAGIGQTREQYEQQAFVCTVSYQGAQEDITWQSFTPHGPIAFLPLSDVGEKHYASLVWYDTPERISHLKKLSNEDLLTHFQEEYPENLPLLLNIEERASFPLFRSHALAYIKQGVALAGDAAHTINPLAGQGVNLGILDAAALIEILIQANMNNEDIASEAVLKRYQKARRTENQIMMTVMDAFYYGFSNTLLPLRILRNIGLGLANNSGFAKNNVMKYAIGASGDLPKLARV
jgi:2-octaprenyl-3-methyl-6-methoxy-1,4-benzoquinol hydroxylase